MTKRFTRQQLDAMAQDRDGCVKLQYARSTGLLVGIYRAAEAGIETDPSAGKWATVCEDHANCVCHQTRKDAAAWASDPLMWCEPCQENMRNGKIMSAKDLQAICEDDIVIRLGNNLDAEFDALAGQGRFDCSLLAVVGKAAQIIESLCSLGIELTEEFTHAVLDSDEDTILQIGDEAYCKRCTEADPRYKLVAIQVGLFEVLNKRATKPA